jgi:uncharacterized membrane protein
MHEVVFLLHLGTTLFMAGLVWFVQVVHYPLLAHLAGADFAGYERAHRRLATAITLPVMSVEAITAGLLLVQGPTGFPAWWVWLNAELLVIVWLSTLFVQLPLHRRLSRGGDATLVRHLVLTNWLRTLVWSVRAAGWLVLLGLARA